MINIIFLFISIMFQTIDISINFEYLLEAEKQLPKLSNDYRQESYEAIYGNFFINYQDLKISVKPELVNDEFRLNLDEIVIKKNNTYFGLINPEFSGYRITFPSAKFMIFPYLAKVKPGNVFGLGYLDNNFNLVLGARGGKKYLIHANYLFETKNFNIIPFVYIMGRDDYTNSYETYIPGIEINFQNFKSGFMYQLCHYVKQVKSYVFWSSLDFSIKKFNINYDVYYKNSEPFYDVIRYENDLLYTSGKLSYSINNEIKLWIGGYYLNELTSLKSENSLFCIGISYNFDNNFFSASGGYGKPEALILRWQGYLDQQFSF